MGMFKKVKSLSSAFAAASRRWVVTTAVISSGLFFSATAQTPTAPTNNNIKTEQTVETPARLTAEQKEKINTALIEQGQKAYRDLLPYAQSDYSCQLESLEQYLNQRVKEINPDASAAVVVLDPLQMDIGTAMGTPTAVTAMKMLSAKGVFPDFTLFNDAGEALTYVMYFSLADDMTYTQFPITLSSRPDPSGKVTYVVIPLSNYAPAFEIKGLSIQDEANFTDRHEGWHALDFALGLKSKWPIIDFSKLKVDSLQTTEDKINNACYLKFSCDIYNCESFADIGAAGDMIRSGQSPEIIGHLIDWRLEGKYDASHMSPPALRELQKRITALGIDKFRALDDTEATSLYSEILDTAGLTPARLALVYKYLKGTDAERAAMVTANQGNPDFACAYSYIACFKSLEVPDIIKVPRGEFKLTPEMQKIADAVGAWDAKGALEKRAFELGGKITPISLAKAYCSLMNELDDSLLASAENDQILCRTQIIRLKNSFFESVQDADYVAVNAKYGVDIVAAEPSLQKIVEEQKIPLVKKIRIALRPKR